jgi:hypothetical protein
MPRTAVASKKAAPVIEDLVLSNGQSLKREAVAIRPLRQQIMVFELQGTAPLKQLRFSQKAQNKMAETQAAGSQARSKRVREARKFEDDYAASMYRFEDGGYGINAGAFRNGMISACRTIGFKMTLAKLSIFIEADGYDALDRTPLVRLYGEPRQVIDHVRNANGVADLRVRACWDEWRVVLRVRFDLEQFSVQDVFNLLVRTGAQVGIGEGRADSPNSAGTGNGFFEVLTGDL